MADKSFILELGKLLIAAAWADGTLSTEEVNGLKELLFQLPDISGEEWMELELYMVSPVTEEERQRLLNRVLQRITSQTDKALAQDALRKLVLSESQGADPQIEVVKQLQEDIEQGSTGFLEHLRRPLRRILNLRGQQYSEEHDRESRLEDFIKNTIYFQVTMELRDRGITFDLPDSDIRKLCLTAGLMARVAGIDHTISKEETAIILTNFTLPIVLRKSFSFFPYLLERISQEFRNHAMNEPERRALKIPTNISRINS